MPPLANIPARVLDLAAVQGVAIKTPLKLDLRIGTAEPAGGDNVASAPMQIQFDPKLLRLNDVGLGDFFSRGGQQPVFTKNIQNDVGLVVVQLNLPPGSGGVSGSGTLVTLNFQAVARGAALIRVPNLTVRSAQGAVVSNSTPQLTVTVK